MWTGDTWAAGTLWQASNGCGTKSSFCSTGRGRLRLQKLLPSSRRGFLADQRFYACSADDFCSGDLDLGVNLCFIEGICRGFSRAKYVWQTIKWLTCFLQSINISLIMNSVFLEMRQAQCSHPDVHSSRLEDFQVQKFCLGHFSSAAAFILGR